MSNLNDDQFGYRGNHQPSLGPPIHNLLEPDEDGGPVAPNDIYTHMHYYGDRIGRADTESMDAIQRARQSNSVRRRPAADNSHLRNLGVDVPDRPEESDESLDNRRERRQQGAHHVTIYRAAPRGIKSLNTGDWVTPSPSYAREHSKHAIDKTQDMPVYKARVQAKHVRWAADSINEFGYSGPPVPAKIHSRGGTNAERVADQFHDRRG